MQLITYQGIKEAARQGRDVNNREQVYLAQDIANRGLHSEDLKQRIDAFRGKRLSS